MNLSERDKDRIIEMAWEDRTPFSAIAFQFGMTEKDVIKFMRGELSPSGFRRWRRRVTNRQTKHLALRNNREGRFKSTRQKAISGNRLSKPKK